MFFFKQLPRLQIVIFSERFEPPWSCLLNLSVGLGAVRLLMNMVDFQSSNVDGHVNIIFFSNFMLHVSPHNCKRSIF